MPDAAADIVLGPGLTVSKATGEVWRDGVVCGKFTGQESRLLNALVQHAGNAMAHDTLFNVLYDHRRIEPNMYAVRVHVHNIRRKLLMLGAEMQIRTVRQFGYELCRTGSPAANDVVESERSPERMV